jgi:hypothetical protein
LVTDMSGIEHDPPIPYAYGAFPGEISGESVSRPSNSIAIANGGMIADQLARLKAENAELRKFNSDLGDEVYTLRARLASFAPPERPAPTTGEVLARAVRQSEPSRP